MIEYEKCVRTIKNRNHKILLLVEQNNVQKKTIENYESDKIAGEFRKIKQRKLTAQRQIMKLAIKKLKIDYEK